MTGLCTRLAAHGALLLALLGTAAADEAVLRVVDVKALGQTPVLEHRQPAVSKWFHAFVGTTGAIRDRFRTGQATVAALEFFIGGRVGLSKDTEIEVVSERSARDVSGVRRVVLHNGALWAKSGKLRQPLEIQTNGGIMGVKGTEFVLESSDGKTNLAVLEGAVEVSDLDRQPVGTAEAGDTFTLAAGETAWQKQHRDPEQLRRELEESPVGQSLAIIQEEIQFLRRDLSSAAEKLERLQQMLNDQAGPDYDLAPPYGKALRSGLARPPLSGMSPQGSGSAVPVFRWDGYPAADGYVLFVSADPKFQSLLFSLRSRDTVAVYPSTARPLAQGRYYWRVIPVDASDRPLQGASQATFQVAAQP